MRRLLDIHNVQMTFEGRIKDVLCLFGYSLFPFKVNTKRNVSKTFTTYKRRSKDALKMSCVYLVIAHFLLK